MLTCLAVLYYLSSSQTPARCFKEYLTLLLYNQISIIASFRMLSDARNIKFAWTDLNNREKLLSVIARYIIMILLGLVNSEV